MRSGDDCTVVSSVYVPVWSMRVETSSLETFVNLAQMSVLE